MIEIALGVLLIVGVMASAVGYLPAGLGFDPLPLLGYGGLALLLAAGLLLIAAGSTRRALKRRPGARHGLRSARLATAALLATGGLAIGLPLLAELLNLIRVAEFPLGYYLAAQGGLIGLVILAFAWAGRQNRIDAEEQARD